jgi:hypothetical protein
MAIDTAGFVLVAGDTGSSDFPGTAGGAQTVRGGGSFDAFVARVALATVAPVPARPIPALAPWTIAMLAAVLFVLAMRVNR